jgi:hypothetical protein
MTQQRSPITNWNRLLHLERDLAGFELHRYCSSIHSLEPPWPERHVYRKAAIDRFSDDVLKIGRQIRWNSQAHSIFVRFEESWS